MKRFWDKVDKSGECWEWMAFRHPKGYGQFSIEGKKQMAHRVAYELEVGPIPEGLTIDHLCRNRSCVNPVHLEPVTNRENIRRGKTGQNMASKTHCPQGHRYDETNTYVHKGMRHCRECMRVRSRDYQRRKRADQRRTA